MSKRWTLDEDRFVHAYFDAAGDFIGPRALARPKGAASARARLLRRTGAWEAITKIKDGEREYLRCLGHRLDDIELALIANRPLPRR